jgi:hypothetical protein
MGFLASFIVCVHLVVNLFLIGSISVKKFIQSVKLCLLKRRIKANKLKRVENSAQAALLQSKIVSQSNQPNNVSESGSLFSISKKNAEINELPFLESE